MNAAARLGLDVLVAALAGDLGRAARLQHGLLEVAAHPLNHITLARVPLAALLVRLLDRDRAARIDKRRVDRVQQIRAQVLGVVLDSGLDFAGHALRLAGMMLMPMLVQMMILDVVKVAVLVGVAQFARGDHRRLDSALRFVVSGDQGRARHTHNASLDRLLDAQEAATAATLRIDDHAARFVDQGALDRVVYAQVLVGARVEDAHRLVHFVLADGALKRHDLAQRGQVDLARVLVECRKDLSRVEHVLQSDVFFNGKTINLYPPMMWVRNDPFKKYLE
jgi:hypothetical protein